MSPSIGGFTSIKMLRANLHEPTSEITLTSGAGVLGDWVQLIASTAFQVNYLNLDTDEENTSNEYQIDIGTGAAGSEVVLITKIHHHINLTGQNIISQQHDFKVEIPPGTRIAARVVATDNTDTINIVGHLTGTN